MSLVEFIRSNREQIVAEWEAFARTRLPAAAAMSKERLRNHAGHLVDAVMADMEVLQSPHEQEERSKGRGSEHRLDLVAETHAGLRAEAGFSVTQLVSEYRALRASIIRLWEESIPGLPNTERAELTRFNEAIDQALTASLDRYTEKFGTYRDQFLGILGHDLRNPMGAIQMAATVLVRSEDLPAKHVQMASRILNSVTRMTRLVSDLLDLTRTRLGGGIPITPRPTELGVVCREVIEETRAYHPDRVVVFEAAGSLRGEWDGDRLAQVVSNLVSNAIQHGREDTPITVTARDQGEHVLLTIHNEGPPIPETAIDSVFEPLVREPTHGTEATGSSSLGLGLFIVREIVSGHGGDIRVTSSKEHGTTFAVRLPRSSFQFHHHEGEATSRDPR
jgi:signal transduction histidine kinase